MTRKEILSLKKLVAELPVPEEVTPLTEYAGYHINRDDEYVEFGCGEVTVEKKDLANAIECLELEETVKELTKLKAKLTSKRPEYTASFRELAKQYRNYNSSITPSYIKSIGAPILRRILGV